MFTGDRLMSGSAGLRKARVERPALQLADALWKAVSAAAQARRVGN